MRFAATLGLVLIGCGGGDDPRDAACARVEAAWSLDDVPAATCTAQPAEPRDLSGEAKLAVAVYHFNVQYVAGGLRGFPDGEITRQNDFDEAQLEDRIVREGLEPVLDLFLAHPTFAADIELQAYMVEIIATRHPDVLTKMQTLANRGQIDFDSFHYSDQLYIAYPKEDLEVSLDLVDGIFSRACLPIGRSVFTQEGQFAAGQLPLAAARGRRASVFPKNLFFHQHGRAAVDDGVLFEGGAGHTVIVGGEGYATNDFELAWTFMDDGEIAFSDGRLNPYFGADYVVDPEAIAEHIARLEAMEAEGYVHATIAEAVQAMEKRGLARRPLPTTFDGTWQPDDTGNVYRWMGGSGIFRPQERDSAVLAAIWRARTTVETVASGLRDLGSGMEREITSAWREVLLAQVSDSTGWNPFIGEVEYSLEKSAAAEALAADVALCAGLVTTATPITCSPTNTTFEDLGAELIAPVRAVRRVVEACEVGGLSAHRISLFVDAEIDEEPLLDPTAEAGLAREVELRFALADRTVRLAPALTEDMVTYDLDAYAFEWTGIPLPHGVVSVGPARWVVQELATGRTVALLTRTGTHADVLRLSDTTVSRAFDSTSRVYVIDGADATEAMFAAKLINRGG